MKSGTLLTLFVISIVFYFQAFALYSFSNPESVIYDAERDRYFITNVGTGNIFVIDSQQDTALYYHVSPHCLGMVIVEDTLYVTAQTKILGFDLNTDNLILGKSISGSSDLNDITADTSGNLYLTDSYGQLVFKYNIASQDYDIIVSGIYWPNGILFDDINNRLLLCSFGSNAPIRAIELDGSSVDILIYTGLTNLDGLTEDNNGSIYVSSWGSNAVFRSDRDFIEPLQLVLSGLSGPADIYFDKVNNILCIPNFNSNTVDFIDMDTDNDSVLNIDDNCPENFNPDQSDLDADGLGDICDNCTEDFNPDQSDFDSDNSGDTCDNCPDIYNPDQADSDQDGTGDLCDYICGDTDDNGSLNLLDIVFLISYLYKGGPAPNHMQAADPDGNGAINILDITYMINFLYKNGPEPNCS